MTTVTNNSPSAINTSLFDLEKQLEAEINEIRNNVKNINNEIGDINASGTVVSVNGKSGIVKLNANDVGALPEDTTIPKDTAQLSNSAGFITIDDVQGYYVPVSRKVNDKELRNDISLTASDVGALPSGTTGENIKVSSTNTSTVASALSSMVKSVNEQLPDANGNVTVTNVKHAATAENATNDSKGNNISTTYATKNDIGNKVNYGYTSMVDLGFTKDSYVSVRDFWTKIYAKYSRGNGVIQFKWADSNSARLGISTNYVTINGGTLIYTCNSPNSAWSNFSAIYINGGGDANKVYHIRAHITDNTTAGAERWGIYTLTNTEYINSKLNSPLPWRYNYLTSGYSSSLPYRKIGEGYFNYPTGYWSFYSEIEMLYHRPNFFERGTIYITMRGRGSSINVMNVRYQYKNGSSSIRLLSNTKVNYKVDTTNKRIYLELLAYCDTAYTMILFRNSLTRTGDMLLTENNFWTFAPTATYVQSSDTMQAGITEGYTEIPMTATGVNITKTENSNNGDTLQIGDGTAVNITNAKHAATSDKATTATTAETADKATKDGKGNNIVDTYATKTELLKASIPLYDSKNARQVLTVNSKGTGTEWVKPQTIKFADYKTENLTFHTLTDQKRIELSNFGPDVTENNVLSFMVIYWTGVNIIAQADWAQSQGTGSSGMACALHSLKTGTGWCVIRCVYLK